MVNAPNLVGHLEYHSPTTDGSFSICAANGKGVFISKALYDSIPAEHRPSLNTSYKPNVDTLNAGIMTSIGTTFFPFILINKDTGERVRVILHALVLLNLFMSMFIGVTGGQIISTSAWGRNGPVFGFNFGQGDDDLMPKAERDAVQWSALVDTQ
ncbi:hypothetical protein CPB84DRAFT_1749385 [Gymnopilus junonius]|uniref:Uncharacterized protein n=1 Tax=Gymnopilus junonius TaxID=109634 RepID=A0A9P5NHU8_GYMJU|nr:hypothetical protein CPB84DRAFT_1749385 [Gymnopilus junonius]